MTNIVIAILTILSIGSLIISFLLLREAEKLNRESKSCLNEAKVLHNLMLKDRS